MDLSKLSDADLLALRAGDLSKVSDAGLMALKSSSSVASEPARDDPSAGGGRLRIGPFDTGISTPEWLDRGLAGAGKALADGARGVGQIAGLVSRDDVAESRRLDAPLMKTTAGAVGNVAGNMAMLAPAALIPGAGTVAGGAAIGAATGILQPSTSTSETIGNVALGGIAGGAVPAVIRAGRAAKAAAEPLSDVGKDRIIGRTLTTAAGKDAPRVVERLREASKPFVGPSQGTPRTVMGEYVPGSIPTVGQAAENAGVAALERTATATLPEVTNAVSDIAKAQNAARVNALSELAGRDGARAFATASRDATAEQLYGAAYRLGIDPAKLTPQALQSINQLSARVPDAVLNRAKELAQISGTPMTDATSVQGMHWVKKAIDDLIGSAKRSGNATLERAYVGLQDDLLGTLDNLSPNYAAARSTYAQMSRPVNQMDVAETIAESSINKLNGNLQPNAYARALSDKTAQRATGFPSATLEGVMDPAQMNVLNSILLDVQRSNAAMNAGRGPGSDTVQKLAYTNFLNEAGVPTFLQNWSPTQIGGNLLARGADAVYGRANRELTQRLAETMLDPGAAAELMARATPQQRNALLQFVRPVASGVSISLPASANAHKE